MNSITLDLPSETFHSPSSVLHFPPNDVYDLSSEPGRSQTSVIDDDEDLIRQTQRSIDDSLESSSSLLSLDNSYNNKHVTRIHRPEVQDDSEIDLVENGEEQESDQPIDTIAQSQEQPIHQLPILTANPMTTCTTENISGNVIVTPAPQVPVVNCGGLQLTHQDIQQIQQQLQQRLLSQPMAAAPPVHVSLPPQQYVILGTVNPNMQPQFILPTAPQTYSIADGSAGSTSQSVTPILQPMNNLLPAPVTIADDSTVSSSKPTSKLTKAPPTVQPPVYVKLHSNPDMSQLEELQNFAKHFKQRRVEMGYTQGDVGAALGLRFPNDFSQTTISRFEASNLSAANMRKLMPLLQRWLDDQEHRQVKLVSDTFANRTSSEPILDAKRRKKRTTIEDNIKDVLEVCFQSNPKPNASDLTRIANEHNIERDVVRVWFCNRRQREKKLAAKYLPMRPIVIQNNPLYNRRPVAATIVQPNSHQEQVTATILQPNSHQEQVTATILQPNSHQEQVTTIVQSNSHENQVYLTNGVETSKKVNTETERSSTEDKMRNKISQQENERDKAAFSAAMMSPQGATLRGYIKPIVFNNG